MSTWSAGSHNARPSWSQRTTAHERARIPLKTLIGPILDLHAEEISARNITIKQVIPDIAVWADLSGLNQALRNLIENALKFTRASATPEIEIGARQDDGSYLLWVRDDGVGFDMHRVEEYPGTGIGLAIVRKAMERIGAYAKAMPGEGATFWLKLPEQQ